MLAANNSANPLIFTTLSAAVNPPITPGQTQEVVPSLASVATSSIFRVQDLALVEPGNTNQELVRIISIPGTGNLTATFKKQHASGSYMALQAPIASLYVQTVPGGAATIFLGNNKSMSNNSYLIAQINNSTAGTQPYDWTDVETGSGINPLNTNEYWAYGTAGDKYNVVLTYI